MDELKTILGETSLSEPIKCVEMHTTGEPTRIVYSGFPALTGTLLEKRAHASEQYDHIRKRLILEPRGHWDMYGAILVPETELVTTGKADMGILFMHNDGFSMMCGHATLALGRFLVDAGESIFAQRKQLVLDSQTRNYRIRLHVPSGLLDITVPALPNGKSDPSRPVSFLSVPSFATGISVRIPLSEEYRWPELGERSSVTADFSYGGVFYCLIDSEELGFPHGLTRVDIARMNHATSLLKAAVNTNPALGYCTTIPGSQDAGNLYSVIVVDENPSIGKVTDNKIGQETGLCFFANQQIDRSPTGGGVAARVALAFARGKLAIGEKRIYDSLLSQSKSGYGAFTGSIAEVLPDPLGNDSQDHPLVRVRIEGQAFYTGSHTMVVEEADKLANNGFALGQLDCCRDETIRS